MPSESSCWSCGLQSWPIVNLFTVQHLCILFDRTVTVRIMIYVVTSDNSKYKGDHKNAGNACSELSVVSGYGAIRTCETWQYDRFCSSENLELAAVYLDSCLANQTYTQMAVVGGVPVELSWENIAKHRCPFWLQKRQDCCSTLSCCVHGKAEGIWDF